MTVFLHHCLILAQHICKIPVHKSKTKTPQWCYCCDQKAWVACAQNFALWQQATIEITQQDHCIIACSRHICMVLFFAHIPFVVNRAFSATTVEWLQHYKSGNILCFWYWCGCWCALTAFCSITGWNQWAKAKDDDVEALMQAFLSKIRTMSANLKKVQLITSKPPSWTLSKTVVFFPCSRPWVFLAATLWWFYS